MKILAVDYGKAKIGLAVACGSLSEPLMVIRYKNIDYAFKKIKEAVEQENIEKVIVGISEGIMGEESKKFTTYLKEKLGVSVETFDETLSTHEAQERSILAGIGPKKRREMEDAYAASVILQSYLDRNP